jgi:hypothetical protein
MAKMLGRQCVWMMKMIIQGKVGSLCHILNKYHIVVIQHFFILLILIPDLCVFHTKPEMKVFTVQTSRPANLLICYGGS